VRQARTKAKPRLLCLNEDRQQQVQAQIPYGKANKKAGTTNKAGTAFSDF
jgi:hypothetical protein